MEFSREIFSYLYEYKGEDRFLKELAVVFDNLRNVLDVSAGMEVLSSEISLGRSPPKIGYDMNDESKEIEPINV